MKFLSLLTLAASVLVSMTLSSCRGAVYTAPLLPKFSVTSASIAVTGYTNTATNTDLNYVECAATIKLKDLIGDVGFTVWINSVTLYTQSTNTGDQEYNLLAGGTFNAPAIGKTYKTVTKAALVVNTEYAISETFKTDGINATYNASGINSITNTGKWKSLKGVIGVSYVTEHGEVNGAAGSLPLDDFSKLETSWTYVQKP